MTSEFWNERWRVVHEHHVAGAQLREDRQVDVLERLADHLVADAVDLGTGMRVDGHDSGRETVIADRSPHELRRVPEPTSMYVDGRRATTNA